MLSEQEDMTEKQLLQVECLSSKEKS